MSKYSFSPDYAIPPGATLKETIDVKGISQAELSLRTGLAEKTISQIINGVAPITYDTAEKLELAIGVPARFWNSRESIYREALLRAENAERLHDALEWLKEIPVQHLIEQGMITPAKGAELVRAALKFFGVSSVEAWRATWLRTAAQYRSHGADKRKPGFVAAWCRMGQILAESIECTPYDAKAFKEALRYIRTLIVEDAACWQPEMVRACAAAGVAVVFIKEIPGASVSGATWWLTKDKALILLSLKYKTDDQFWFTFFHEAAHILLHGKKEVFIDDGPREGGQEDEANRFAGEWLIPPAHDPELAYLKSKVAIRAFSQRLGLSPGIVVGRLQREGILQPSFCNDLKRKLKWSDQTTDHAGVASHGGETP
jgi:HTH-type transcriptional regulator/antitoxin HigA